MNNRKSVKGILFDLDGTLLDTAPDMADALNELRKLYSFSPLALETIRPYIGHGVRAILKLGFNIDETNSHYLKLSENYLDLYENCLAKKTVVFPHVEEVLSQLDKAKLPWGIVTNKSSRFAIPLFEQFNFAKRAVSLVCGDTLAKRKPDPEPILFAAAKMQLDTSHLIYVGDAVTDVMASQNAKMRSLVALYGYIHQEVDPYQWNASGYLKNMLDLLPWIESTLT